MENNEILDLKAIRKIIKETGIGSGKPSKLENIAEVKWMAAYGRIEGGMLYFYTKEDLGQSEITSEVLKIKAEEAKQRLINDLVATGAFSHEELQVTENRPIDLVVKANGEIYRKMEQDGIIEGKEAYIGGSIKFYSVPNLDAMKCFRV